LIDRLEIMELAREFGLAPNVVEKDYVLGWLLAGISNHAELGAAWVFKGGTCLKKCYFETYRFSEDLDFTLPDASTLDETRLRQILAISGFPKGCKCLICMYYGVSRSFRLYTLHGINVQRIFHRHVQLGAWPGRSPHPASD
jgi:hypothetical protein